MILGLCIHIPNLNPALYSLPYTQHPPHPTPYTLQLLDPAQAESRGLLRGKKKISKVSIK